MGDVATTSGVRAEPVCGPAALDRLGDELDELMEAAGVPVTARRAWLACWARHHPAWTPLVVTTRRDGRLRGAAPLAVRVRHGMARVTLLGHGTGDYGALPVRTPSDADPLATAIAATLRGRPWTAHLAQLPVGDPVVGALCGRLPAVEVAAGDPVVAMPIDPPGADLRAAVRARGRRQARNGAHRLRRDGLAMDVRRLGTPAEVRAALPEIRRVRAARNAAVGLDDHADPGDHAFWAEIAPLLAGRGEAEVVELRFGGELACYALCLRDGTAYRGWDTRFDPRFARYSPGHLLREAILAGLAGGPWTEYDMMRGTEAYKYALPARTRALTDLRAWSPGITRLPHDLRRRAAGVRDRHPRLAAADRAVRRTGHRPFQVASTRSRSHGMCGNA